MMSQLQDNHPSSLGTETQISVVIVNYNVKYFLEQCLNTVTKALKKIEGEVFVVDNNSIDDSVEMVKTKFPEIQLITNKENVGFSRANNQAILKAKGKYVLLLNPDTLVEEDTFEKVINFMDQTPEAGGLGVKMIDGKGEFLPESKRGLPTPWVAFYKICGLSSLFPKSKKFGKYHLGFLNKEETHEIEILAGCFMLLRKKALDKVGLLDESFFMYGEDIDLSYRIILGGYKNYYFPHTRIIHYKGESTKKSSVNYVFVFYKAMVIFAKKHFTKKNAKIFSFFINLAIYLRASIAIFNRLVKRSILPITDFLISLLGLFFITHYYGIITGKNYPEEIISIALPAYALIWLISIFFNGGYDKPTKLLKIIMALLFGTSVILMIYALLPKELQFSRLIILLGTGWSILTYMGVRLILHLLNIDEFKLNKTNGQRFAVVGDLSEANRVVGLLNQTIAKPNFIGIINPLINGSKKFIGDISQLEQIVEIYKIDELIFCAKNLSSQDIIYNMSLLGRKKINYKIAPPESLFIIGSNSIETSGDLYILNINSINKPHNLRNKRILDIITSLCFIFGFPLFFFLIRKKMGFLRNIGLVLIGTKSWVGYQKTTPSNKVKLPKIKNGVLSPIQSLSINDVSDEIIEKMNIIYAKNYQVLTDLSIILKGFRYLGKD